MATTQTTTRPAKPTRPADFGWTSNFNADGTPEREYRITEPEGVSVLDASSGRNPGRDRRRVQASLASKWNGPTPTDRNGRTVWEAMTKGYSDHGNASTYRTFDTVAEADAFIRRWATRRWRVAVTTDNQPTNHPQQQEATMAQTPPTTADTTNPTDEATTAECANCGTPLGQDCGEAEPDYDSRHCSTGCWSALVNRTIQTRNRYAPTFDPPGRLDRIVKMNDQGRTTIGVDALLDIVAAAEFLELNSSDEHGQRRAVIVINADDRPFLVRLVMPGDRYGAIGHNVGQRDLLPNELCRVNDGQPLIAWYDLIEKTGWYLFTPIGQHTGATYTAETMGETYRSGTGLNLSGDVDPWTVDAKAIAQAYRVLVIEQGLDPAYVQGNNGGWNTAAQIANGGDLPWFRLDSPDCDDDPEWSPRLTRAIGHLDDLLCIEAAKVAQENPDDLPWVAASGLARWGLAWRDCYTGRIERTILGQLWARWWLDSMPTKVLIDAADGAVEKFREMVIDALDRGNIVAGGLTDVSEVCTFNERVNAYNQARAFRAYLVSRER